MQLCISFFTISKVQMSSLVLCCLGCGEVNPTGLAQALPFSFLSSCQFLSNSISYLLSHIPEYRDTHLPCVLFAKSHERLSCPLAVWIRVCRPLPPEWLIQHRAGEARTDLSAQLCLLCFPLALLLPSANLSNPGVQSSTSMAFSTLAEWPGTGQLTQETVHVQPSVMLCWEASNL